jgi:hypothetical protein
MITGEVYRIDTQGGKAQRADAQYRLPIRDSQVVIAERAQVEPTKNAK